MVEGVQTNWTLRTCFNGQAGLVEESIFTIQFSGLVVSVINKQGMFCLVVDVFQCGVLSHVLHIAEFSHEHKRY